VYIADNGNARVREVLASSGLITTTAGTGVSGYSGDGQAASNAQVNLALGGIALDSQNNVTIADNNNNRIRTITARTQVITTVAGTGGSGYNGDNIAATAATLTFPRQARVGPDGNQYIADTANNRIREVIAATGVITTIAGSGAYG
jgi:hypothetical protein